MDSLKLFATRIRSNSPCTSGLGCRSLRFVKPVDGFALHGHVIENISLPMPFDDVRFECRSLCGMESTCVSINIGLPGNDGVSLCQLSNSDHIQHPEDLKPQEGFLYWATRNPCSNNPCLHNATCLNGFTDKRYICLCQVGYTGEHCENEIDECTMNSKECGANAVCISNECICKDGFHGDGITCMDIDECETDNNTCDVNADCMNTAGSYSCKCKAGYIGDGQNCKDIDECAAPVDPCVGIANSVCNNTNGSYICECKDGFVKNGPVCEDIDECAASVDPCNAVANSVCNNTNGSYNCQCEDGFTKNGSVCKDIDECAAALDPCNTVANSACNNTDGSYNCLCKVGFVKDGLVCEDIDECAAPVDPCNAVANSACNNTNGSYICHCKDGFIKNDSICEDINECAAKVDPCSTVTNSACNNTNGSYNCLCKDGFVKNGAVCEADVCQNYQTLSDAERKETYVRDNSAPCDKNLSGWYRFQGAAGTQMAVKCPSAVNSCGAWFPGWLSDSHPTVAEGIVTRKVCFRKNKKKCSCDSWAYIKVKNCGSYYIYQLNGTPTSCNSRYCGKD